MALLEREAVLEAASKSLERARRGQGGVLAIVGEGGLGKTSVLEWACSQARPHMDVGRARGEAIEESLAFGVAHQALEALSDGDLVGLGSPAGAELSAPFYRVLSWLKARSSRPLLLAVDDLQWADQDSLRLFSFLARRVEGLPLALIGTLRPWPPSAYETCRELAQASCCTLEHVRPLSRAAASSMLRERSGIELSEHTQGRIWELSAGNPLLVGELASAVGRGERVPEAGASPGAAPGLAKTLLLSRFAGVDAPALQCARAASVLGTEFRLTLAAEVAGVEEAEIEGALESLSRSGLMVERDGRTRFAHPLFAETLYQDLAPPVRRRLHERAFRILAARGLEPEAAAHAVAAQLIGDRQAEELLARAGHSALAAGAVASAVTLLSACARTAGNRVPAQVAIALAEALLKEGRVADALQALEAPLASRDLPWRERYAALRVHGHVLQMAGSIELSGQAHEHTISLALENGSPALAVDPLLDQTEMEWLLRGPGAAIERSARARATAAGAEGPVADRAEALWAKMAFQTGDSSSLEPALELLARLDGRGQGRPIGPEELLFPGNIIDHAVEVALMAEHFAEAERGCVAVEQTAEGAGAASALCTALCLRAEVLTRRGRLTEALAVIGRWAKFAELIPTVRGYLELWRAEPLLWLGRFDESEAAAQIAERELPPIWYRRLRLAHLRGLRLLWQGDALASDAFLEAEEVTSAAGIREPCVVCWAGHAVDAHLAFGRSEDALRVLGWLEECAAALPCHWPKAAAHLGRAAFAAREDDKQTAIECYQAGLSELEQIDRPLQRVEALLAYGGFLRRHGAPRDARAPLGEARQLAETLAATWLADAARRELQLAGGRRRRRSADRDHLTDAERRVAELAADGYTNAEIARRLYLSVSTIETHLRHVFGKLEIRSRRELQAFAPVFQPLEPDERRGSSSASR